MGDENPLMFLLGGGGLAVILGAFVKGAWDYFKGRHDRERHAAKDRRDTITVLKDEVRHAEASARDAHTEMVTWRTKAGLYWEYAHSLRQRLLCKHQEDAEDLPPWPRAD